MDQISEELKLIEAIKSCKNIDKMRSALRCAMNLIDNYRMDIKNTNGDDSNLNFVGVDLVKAGFCQGSIYLEAHTLIRSFLEEIERE